MKKLLTIIAITLFTLSACATGGKTATGTISMDQAIADATDILSANVSERTEIVIAAIKAPDNAVENYLADEITAYLMQSGKFTVLARGNALKAVDAEQEFQLSGMVSDDSAVGIGHYLGAKVVVTGTFDLYNDFNQLRLRAVDVRTSQLLAMTSSRIHPRDRVLANVLPQTAKPQRIQVSTLDHLNRGLDLYREGRHDEAISALDEAIRREPKNALAFAARADVYNFGKKDKNAAIADYNEAIRLNGKNPAWYISRAFAHSYLDDDDSAIAGLLQGIRANPNNGELYYILGTFYEAESENDLALNNYNQAIRLDPNLLDAYSARGGLYTQLENYDLAIADYTQFIRRAHRETDAYELSIAYRDRGDIYYRYKKDYDKAIADYTEAIRFAATDKEILDHTRHSMFGRFYKSLGDAYNAKGDNNRAVPEYDRAIAAYTEAIQINPNDKTIYTLRGSAYLSKREYDSAIADFESALRLDPNDFSARGLLESARERRGN